MPMSCLLDNECLACLGGCEGYERKEDTMREARASYWRAVESLPESRRMREDFEQAMRSSPLNGLLAKPVPEDTDQTPITPSKR